MMAESGIEGSPVAAARAAGLRYLSDAIPGMRRRRAGRGFAYYDPQGRLVRDPETLRRIRSLAIPPAWTDVWISPSPRGHIQATGRDSRGRKQYRYHPRWRETRDQAKFERLLAFGEALPRLREQLRRDLSRPGLPREKVLAAVTLLLEKTLIRVGNEEYARHNRSFGLTTLRTRHTRVEGATLQFHFRGKGGKEHAVRWSHRRVASIVRRCQELPGQLLFQYLDDAGQRHAVESDDVNQYLRQICGEEFTAKDFRTWAGTLLAARMLAALPPPATPTQARQALAQVIDQVAAQLNNTRAVCRRCYVHPAVVESYSEGTLATLFGGPLGDNREQPDLEPDEAALLALLRSRQRLEESA